MDPALVPSDKIWVGLEQQRKRIPSAELVVGASWEFEIESRIDPRFSLSGAKTNGGLYVLFKDSEGWKSGCKSTNYHTVGGLRSETQDSLIAYELLEDQHERVRLVFNSFYRQVPSRYKIDITINSKLRERNLINRKDEFLFETKLTTRVRLRIMHLGFVLERKQWVFEPGDEPADINSTVNSWLKKFIDSTRGTTFSSRMILPTDPIIRFSPSASAALFHELLGHPSESDCRCLYIDKLEERPMENERLRQLSVFDDPFLVKGLGSQRFDDDGEQSQRSPLFRNGKFCGSLGTLVSPGQEGAGNNARKMNFSSFPLPRGTNLVIEGGKEPVEESDSTIVIPTFSSGFVMPHSGEFQLVGSNCYLEDGRGNQLIGDILVHGEIRSTLENLVSVHNDPELSGLTCGKKGQWVVIGTSAPSLSFGNLKWQIMDG